MRGQCWGKVTMPMWDWPPCFLHVAVISLLVSGHFTSGTNMTPGWDNYFITCYIDNIIVDERLASFPGSCAWAEKKEPGTHCFVHAQFPQDFWELSSLSISAKRFSMWLTQSFLLKFTDHLEWSNAECYRQSNIAFDLKIARMCPIGSITMQCGLQQVSRNWP